MVHRLLASYKKGLRSCRRGRPGSSQRSGGRPQLPDRDSFRRSRADGEVAEVAMQLRLTPAGEALATLREREFAVAFAEIDWAGIASRLSV